MNSLEPKKLALIRIYQILQRYSDEKHPMTQEKIAESDKFESMQVFSVQMNS